MKKIDTVSPVEAVHGMSKGKYSVVPQTAKGASKGDVRVYLRDQLEVYARRRRPVLPRTEKDYSAKAVRLNAARGANVEPPDLESLAGTKKSFYALRAAFLFDAARRGQQALQSLARADRAGDKVATAAAWVEIRKAAADFRRYPPGAGKELQWRNTRVASKQNLELEIAIFGAQLEHLGDWTSAVSSGRVRPTKEKRNAKRRDAERLRKIAPDWRQRIVEAMPQHWKVACALMSLSGCRPEELTNGILIDVNRDKYEVQLTIQGAKTNDGHGQPVRQLFIRDDGPEFELLVAHTGNYMIPSGYADPLGALRKAMERCGKRVLPKNAPIVSGYCFRHALAADLKADGASREQIALTLGHSVTETATAYGRANGGTKGIRHLKALGTREVKVNHGLGVKKPSSSGPASSGSYTSPGF